MRASSVTRMQEHDALLPGPSPRRSRTALFPIFNSWVAHPLWVIPVILIVSMSRGVTMSPRIQVYKAVACRSLNQEVGGRPDLGFLGSPSTLVDCTGSEVQARAARIQASVTTLMNVLSAITTGFWSRFGDNHGRKSVMFLFLLGAIAMEFVHVLIMNAESIFGQHAESFILVGPILEGMVGALSSFHGVIHAYSSDCTRHGSRSKIFSTVQAALFVGLAMGPWFSSLVLPASVPDVNNAFYLSMSLLAATLVYLVLILPESRQPTLDDRRVPSESHVQFKVSPILVLRRHLHRFASALIIPITIFAPRQIPSQPHRKNYNLTLVGAAIFVYVASNSVGSIRYLYAQHVYDWTTTQLGYYMSFLWIAKAINLLFLLPSLISYLKPARDGHLQENVAAELVFDKRLAQCSLGLDCAADTLVAIVPRLSQETFITLSSLSSFSSGGNPALHSLGAICLPASTSGSEIGALFGGIAVLSAVAHIVSPYLSALIYGSTVAYFPKAIFAYGALLLGTIIVLLSAVKAQPEEISTSDALDDDEGLIFREDRDA